jgi:hypothetical protein
MTKEEGSLKIEGAGRQPKRGKEIMLKEEQVIRTYEATVGSYGLNVLHHIYFNE